MDTIGASCAAAQEQQPQEQQNNTLNLFQEFQALTERKKELDAELKSVNARLGFLEPLLVEWLVENDMQNIKAGGRTFYLHRSLFAGRDGVENEEFCDAMREAGLEDMVKESVNANTLKAWVREIASTLEPGATPQEIMEAMPAALHGKIRIAEVYGVRSRKA